MPVLIILLYYIHDLSKLKRWYDQSEFAAQQMVNIIQNISQKRAELATTEMERKKLLRIRLSDILYASRISSLSIYPGVTQHYPYPLYHFPGVLMYYVKNNKNGTATCKWVIRHMSTHGRTVFCGIPPKVSVNGSTVSYKDGEATSPSNIHPNLKFGSEDAKIIVEAVFPVEKTDSKTAFGFYLVNPKAKDLKFYFQSVLIFAPKAGLFYESGVKESYTDDDF